MRGLALPLAACLAACSRSSAPAPASGSASASASAPASASASGSASASAPPPRCSASLDERTAEARREYGADVHLVTVDGTFLFIDPDRGPHFSRSVAFAPRVLAALRHDRIGVHALCPVSVHVFSSGDHFKEYCAAHDYLPGSGRDLGVYDHRRGVILTDLSGGEAYVFTIGARARARAHGCRRRARRHPARPHARPHPALVSRVRHVALRIPRAPRPGGDIHGTDDWRYLQLRPAVAARESGARLGALFGMSDYDFRGEMRRRRH